MMVFHGFSPFQGQYINITRESTFLHQGMECKFLRPPMELRTLHHSQRRLPASPWRHSPRACYLLTMQVDRHHLSFRHDGINMDQSCLIRSLDSVLGYGCHFQSTSLPGGEGWPVPDGGIYKQWRLFREGKHLLKTNQLMQKEQLSGPKFPNSSVQSFLILSTWKFPDKSPGWMVDMIIFYISTRLLHRQPAIQWPTCPRKAWTYLPVRPSQSRTDLSKEAEANQRPSGEKATWAAEAAGAAEAPMGFSGISWDFMGFEARKKVIWWDLMGLNGIN